MTTAPEETISAVRRFNRFYTRRLGVLRRNFLDLPYSLGEVRILFEIATRDDPIASDIAAALDLDAGYLSRVLRNFEKRGLIHRTPSESDGRQIHLGLTAAGRKLFAEADRQQAAQVNGLLDRLPDSQRDRLASAMTAIERILGPEEARTEPVRKRRVVLRQPGPGDLGWVIMRHGELYGAEYGWGGPFEGMCAKIVGAFSETFDPALERCWIADVDGARAGCIFLVRDEKPGVARIRLLLLEPHARGLGLGKKLVDSCIRFAREAGYRSITLWTHEELSAARGIYAKAGFRVSATDTHDSWGKTVRSETWDLDL